jgi:hypothetical protein
LLEACGCGGLLKYWFLKRLVPLVKGDVAFYEELEEGMSGVKHIWSLDVLAVKLHKC